MKRYLFSIMLSMTSLVALNSSYAMMDEGEKEAKYIAHLQAVQTKPTDYNTVINFFDTAQNWLFSPKSPTLEASKLASAGEEISGLMRELPEWAQNYGAKALMQLALKRQEYPAAFNQARSLYGKGLHTYALQGLSELAKASDAEPTLRSQACALRHEIYTHYSLYEGSRVSNLIQWAQLEPSRQDSLDHDLEKALRASRARESHLQVAEHYASRDVADKAAQSYITALSLPVSRYESAFGAVESFLATNGAVKARVKALLSADQRAEEAIYEVLLPHFSEKKDLFDGFMEQTNSPFAKALKALLEERELLETHPLKLVKTMNQEGLEKELEKDRNALSNINYAVEGHKSYYWHPTTRETQMVTLFGGVDDIEYGSYPTGKVTYKKALEMQQQAQAYVEDVQGRLDHNEQVLMRAFQELPPTEQSAVKVFSKVQPQGLYPLPKLLAAATGGGIR